MNLGDGEESPWGDVPSHSPRTTSPPQNGTANDPPKDSAASAEPAAPPAPTLRAPSKPAGKPSRINRTPQPTRLEALDDDLGPLGPLGASSASAPEPVDEPPALPQKEQAKPRTNPPPARPSAPSQASRTDLFGSGQDDNEGIPVRPRQQNAAAVGAPQGQRGAPQPGPAREQAALPTFNIMVGDPHKVGDLTSSHTVYQVRTKTNSKAYRTPDFEVPRRYRDFLWVYNQLHSNNPGVIVPPPPEKQAVGRFEANFVESRRAALERMLNKIGSHPILQNDSDFKLFLESDSFNVDVKHRERKDPDMPAESKGMFSGLNISSGSGGKFIEHDEWFLERRVYLDTLEGQLKALLKSTDVAVAQRKGLAETASELSVALNDLAQVELSPVITGPLASLSDVYIRIRELYDRQAQQDVLTLGITIDEYIRLIGSVKKAFEQRQRTWHGWHNAESDLQKRRSALDKLMRQGRSQQDKMSQLQADVGDAERRAHQARLQFEDIGRGMRAELDRFEREKVEDFRMGVETFLEASVEAQKELIEVWETFLFHLDTDEEERQSAATKGGSGISSAPPAAQGEQQPPTGATDEDTAASDGGNGETPRTEAE